MLRFPRVTIDPTHGTSRFQSIPENIFQLNFSLNLKFYPKLGSFKVYKRLVSY